MCLLRHKTPDDRNERDAGAVEFPIEAGSICRGDLRMRRDRVA
jgi:hypothetical protein